MNTFILKWNPAISNYGMDRFNEDFYFGKKKVIEDETSVAFAWSVWDWKKARHGDRFFLLKVGEGENNGIVMSGVFCSDPYKGEDWSGQGRKTYYMKMEMDIVVAPDTDKVLPTSLLTERLPMIEWTGGHSGILIEPDAALTLEKEWYAHLKSDLSPYAKAKELARIAHFGQKDEYGYDYIYHPLSMAAGLRGNQAIVALLHEAVKHSHFTLDDLAREGFSKAVVSGVRAMTRKEGETYTAFIRRAGRNKIARVVKMADLAYNMGLLWDFVMTDEDSRRLRKYEEAHKYLSSLSCRKGPMN